MWLGGQSPKILLGIPGITGGPPPMFGTPKMPPGMLGILSSPSGMAVRTGTLPGMLGILGPRPGTAVAPNIESVNAFNSSGVNPVAQ